MIITINDDFDLNKIISSGQCFRPSKINDDTYRFIVGKHVLLIKAAGINSYDVSCNEEEWNNVWKSYFDLDTNYSDIRAKIEDDYMSKCADYGKGIRILKQDKWEMLVSFIISQRKSIPAIRSCIEKLCFKFGDVIGEGIYAFPSPLQLSKATFDDLKEAGLGYRIPYIFDACEKVLSNNIILDEIDSLNDEHLFDKLKDIKGVGDKVANCVMLFAYHRVGRAPVDTWISRVINEEYNGINPFLAYNHTAGILQQYVFFFCISRQ